MNKETDSKLLPTPVVRWAELPDNDVDACHDDGLHHSLTELNDDYYDFAQIADVIEHSLVHELQAQEDAEQEHEETHP